MKKIKTIDMNVREWFDKVNGNSYFSAKLTINYGMPDSRAYVIPFQYGCGSCAVETEAVQILSFRENWGMKKPVPLSYYCREKSIVYRYNKQENCKKKDVVAFGQE